MNEKIANGIDWRATKASLDRAQRSIETAFLPDMQHTGELLRARARSLAVRGVRNTGDAAHTPVLIFRLMDMHYGIDLGALSNVGEWMAPSPVPGSNAALLGLISSRGDAWALFDLGRVISSEQKSMNTEGQIMFLRNGPSNIALRIDAVDGIKRMDLRRVKPLPEGILNPGNVISGLINDGILIIDARRLIVLPAFSEVFLP